VAIDYSQGGYILRLSDSARYDADQSVSLLQRAALLRWADPVEAVNHCLQAVSPYEEHYLPGRSCKLWVLAARRHHRRLYTDCLREILEILRRPARHLEIVISARRLYP